MRRCPACSGQSITLRAFLLSTRWSQIQCPECGAKSLIDRRALVRPFLIYAGVTILYVGGILWVAAGPMAPPPWWLVEHVELIAIVWFIPFLATGVWFLRKVFNVPLRVIENPSGPGEVGAL